MDSELMANRIRNYIRNTPLSDDAIGELVAIITILDKDPDYNGPGMIRMIWDYLRKNNKNLSADSVEALEQVAVMIQEEYRNGDM